MRCEPAEGSVKSTFFPQEQCLVILIPRWDKIIIGPLEINLQDHSLVYFDFDRRKNIILFSCI